MHPKSPFCINKTIYIHPKDDYVINFNVQKIKNTDDRTAFIKLRTNIEKISRQLYNLRISKECCKEKPLGCSTNVRDCQILITELTNVKSSLNAKDREIISFYCKDDIESEITRK